MKKIYILIVLMMMAVCGCSDNTPKPEPQFQNFDIAKVTLTGARVQVINNRVQYDETRGCWLIQVKNEKESTVGRMFRKMRGNTDVKGGLGLATMYELELEKIVE